MKVTFPRGSCDVDIEASIKVLYDYEPTEPTQSKLLLFHLHYLPLPFPTYLPYSSRPTHLYSSLLTYQPYPILTSYFYPSLPTYLYPTLPI